MYIRTISDHVISLFSVGLNSLHVVQFTMVHVHVVVHAVYTDCGVWMQTASSTIEYAYY